MKTTEDRGFKCEGSGNGAGMQINSSQGGLIRRAQLLLFFRDLFS